MRAAAMRLSGRVSGLLYECTGPKDGCWMLVVSVSLAGLAAHLSEIWPAAELEPEHQGAVGHSVHIFTLFRVVCTDGQSEVTVTLALLHGCRPLMIQTLIGWLARVGQALYRAHFLSQTALCRTLSPGTHHPLWGRAALQVTADPGSGSALFGALGLWQRVATLPTFTQNHTVPVARTTAGGTL